MALSLNPTSWINVAMAKEPLNWAIVGVIASIWLFAFHIVMTAFSAMQGPRSSVGGGGPGSIAAPTAPASIYGAPGNTGNGGQFGADGNQWFGNDPIWADQFQGKYAEDGWQPF